MDNINNKNKLLKRGLLSTVEDSFDWNLVTIVSIWLFLLVTAFLIYF